MSSEVLKLEDILTENKEKEISKDDLEIIEKLKKKKKIAVPRGDAKSGRPWKSVKQRFKSIVKTRGIKVSNKFEKQMKLKDDLKRVKTITKALVQERQEAKEAKKQRRRDNMERQKKNELKSEIVQVIKNPAKIKKMNRKQLRSIAKRDTTVVSKTKT